MNATFGKETYYKQKNSRMGVFFAGTASYLKENKIFYPVPSFALVRGVACFDLRSLLGPRFYSGNARPSSRYVRSAFVAEATLAKEAKPALFLTAPFVVKTNSPHKDGWRTYYATLFPTKAGKYRFSLFQYHYNNFIK